MHKDTLLKRRIKDHQYHAITYLPYEAAQNVLNQILAMPLGDFIAMVEGRFSTEELLAAVEAENKAMRQEDRRYEIRYGKAPNAATSEAIDSTITMQEL